MYHNILVPISFDPDRDVSASLKLAQILATPEAKIPLLHVVDPVPASALSYMSAASMAAPRQALEAELAALAKTLPNAASSLVIEGHSGRSILDWAETNKPDLVIISSHRPGMQDLLLGSTASQVVRHAACAVHVVR